MCFHGNSNRDKLHWPTTWRPSLTWMLDDPMLWTIKQSSNGQHELCCTYTYYHIVLICLYIMTLYEMTEMIWCAFCVSSFMFIPFRTSRFLPVRLATIDDETHGGIERSEGDARHCAQQTRQHRELHGRTSHECLPMTAVKKKKRFTKLA